MNVQNSLYTYQKGENAWDMMLNYKHKSCNFLSYIEGLRKSLKKTRSNKNRAVHRCEPKYLHKKMKIKVKKEVVWFQKYSTSIVTIKKEVNYRDSSQPKINLYICTNWNIL